MSSLVPRPQHQQVQVLSKFCGAMENLCARVVLTFLRNRSRSMFGLTGARRFLLLAVVLSSIYGFVYYTTLFETSIRKKVVAYPGNIRESAISGRPQGIQVFQTSRTSTRKVSGMTRTLPRALLVTDSSSHRTAKTIQVFLEAHRIPFSVLRLHPTSERAVYDDVEENIHTRAGRPFSIVLVTSGDTVWKHKEWDRLMAYCRVQSVPVVLFFDKEFTGNHVFGGLTGRTVTPKSAQYLEPNPQSVFHYLRPGKRITALPSDTLWNVFELPRQQSAVGTEVGHVTLATHPTNVSSRHRQNARDIQTGDSHTPGTSNELTAIRNDSSSNKSLAINSRMETYSHEVLLQLVFTSADRPGVSIAPIAIKQRGKVEGVCKYFIGGPVSFWAMKLLLLEVLRREVGGELLRFGRERWVMVDIDDIFVAPEGRKMTAADVRVGCVCVCVCVHVCVCVCSCMCISVHI